MATPDYEVCLVMDRPGVRISHILIEEKKLLLKDIRVIRGVANLKSVQSRHFACGNNDKTISVWNIDSGRVVRTINPAPNLAGLPSLSANAKYLVISGKQSTTSYHLTTGLPYHTEQLGSQVRLRPIAGDGAMMVSEKGMTITIPDLQTLDRHTLPKLTRVLHVSKSGDSLDALLFGCPKTDGKTFYQQSWKAVPCDEDCRARPEPICSKVASYIDFESGLKFILSDRTVGEGDLEISIEIHDHWQLEKSRTVLVATLDNMLSKATFAPRERSLVLLGKFLICVFEMPSSFKDNPVLKIVRYMHEGKDALSDSPNKQCPHGRFYFNTVHRGYLSLDSLKDTAFEWPPDNISRDHTLEYLKRHINGRSYPEIPLVLGRSKSIQATGIPGNMFTGYGLKKDPTATSISVMEHICKDLSGHKFPLSKILGESESEWMPPTRTEFNPMRYFLDKANTRGEYHEDTRQKSREDTRQKSREDTRQKSREDTRQNSREDIREDIYEDIREESMTNFKILLDYCLCKTASTRNTAFLGPITTCLPILLDATLPHIEVARATLRGMAFIPAISPPFIIDHRALIHPSKPHRRIWKSSQRRSFTYEEPILQLETAGEKDHVNAAGSSIFTLEVFAATFDILWSDTGPPATPVYKSKPAGVSPSISYWIKMSPFMAKFKLNPWRTNSVRYHDFPRDILDNPAIAALITYKW